MWPITRLAASADQSAGTACRHEETSRFGSTMLQAGLRGLAFYAKCLAQASPLNTRALAVVPKRHSRASDADKSRFLTRRHVFTRLSVLDQSPDDSPEPRAYKTGEPTSVTKSRCSILLSQRVLRKRHLYSRIECCGVMHREADWLNPQCHTSQPGLQSISHRFWCKFCPIPIEQPVRNDYSRSGVSPAQLRRGRMALIAPCIVRMSTVLLFLPLVGQKTRLERDATERRKNFGHNLGATTPDCCQAQI